MQRLEVSGAVRPLYGSLGVKRLTKSSTLAYATSSLTDHSSRHITILNYIALMALIIFSSNATLGSLCKGHQRLTKIYHRIITGRILKKTLLAQPVARGQHLARDRVSCCLQRYLF